jgi:cyanophycinase-like exopeptidase
MKISTTIIACLSILFGYSQSYTYTFVGDTTEVTPTTQFGICMMGGATENNSASTWFLNRSGGGNIVVIRASGGSGYNSYFFSDLGVTVQSVETIVFNNASAANDPFVLRRLQQAEAIWIAGGDQYLYESYWKNSPVRDILNNHVNVKQAPIGGTSAGMAIQGSHYFNAENGSITSAQALSDPYHPNLTIRTNFLTLPFLENVITDTHYNNPDRRGRHATFIARSAHDNQQAFFGIAADEYVAICIDDTGIAKIFGGYPNFQDYAYFIRMNCSNSMPETIQSGTPLTWTADNDALLVYRANATSNGSSTFNLNTWSSGNSGQWLNWTINSGALNSVNGTAPECSLGLTDIDTNIFDVYPNPASTVLNLKVKGQLLFTQLINNEGQVILRGTDEIMDVSTMTPGIYMVRVVTTKGSQTKKVILE